MPAWIYWLIYCLPFCAAWLRGLCNWGWLFFGAYLALGGWGYVAETLTSFSAAIAYPIYLLHAAAPVCGVLVLCFALERMLLGPALEEEAP